MGSICNFMYCQIGNLPVMLREPCFVYDRDPDRICKFNVFSHQRICEFGSKITGNYINEYLTNIFICFNDRCLIY